MKKLLGILLLSGTIAFSGCGSDRDDFVVTNTNNAVVSAPVCADDAYATNSNAVLTVNAATGVLTNDTPNGATVTFQGTSANGGTVVGAQDGSFTYTPAANFAGSDTFTYTLGNSGGVVTCTVTVTVTAVNGFFVDAANGNDGTGNFTGGLPFATVQAAAAAAPVNTDIVVRPGNYTGTVTLKNGQRLLGNGSGLAVNPQGAVRPVFTGPIDMADGNTIDFVRIANTPATVGVGDGNGDAIVGDGQAGGTVTNCEISRPTDDGVSAIGVTGNWDISNNTVTEAGPATTLGIGINLTTTAAPPNATTPTSRATVNRNTVSDCSNAGIGFTSENTSVCEVQADTNVMTGNQTGASFEVLAGNSSVFCLDLENNTNDDTYRFGIQNTAICNVEELQTGPFSVPSNTGTFTVLSGGFFVNPTSVVDGSCNF